MQVLVTAAAKGDLRQIFRYVGREDPAQAQALLEKIYKSMASLNHLAERGHVPPELEKLGRVTFREIHCKPYRIIYERVGETVYVHAVLDGRRGLDELLRQRLL